MKQAKTESEHPRRAVDNGFRSHHYLSVLVPNEQQGEALGYNNWLLRVCVCMWNRLAC